jgi:dihydrodipicolinate synthase/N-acetylneuraminate lyase
MADQWRGIHTILPTPLLEDGSLDEASFGREDDFVVAVGAHGIVTPVNTSELFLLADEEHRRPAEIVVQQGRGRVPVMIGVAEVVA